jgi:predicted HicB family RNase H-like nuclease
MNKSILLRMDLELWQRINDAAQKSGLSLSAWIRYQIIKKLGDKK